MTREEIRAIQDEILACLLDGPQTRKKLYLQFEEQRDQIRRLKELAWIQEAGDQFTLTFRGLVASSRFHLARRVLNNIARIYALLNDLFRSTDGEVKTTTKDIAHKLGVAERDVAVALDYLQKSPVSVCRERAGTIDTGYTLTLSDAFLDHPKFSDVTSLVEPIEPQPPSPNGRPNSTEDTNISAVLFQRTDRSTRPKLIFRTALATYEAVKIIGRGDNGTVYEVRDEDGQSYALKLLDPVKAAATGRRKRFKNEIVFCRTNSHPNIVTVLDDGPADTEKGPSMFYVMERAQGSLRDVMKEALAPPRALHVFAQLMDGVEAAHLKGVVHRDLKPENVLFHQQPDRVVVADFGIAHFGEDDLFTAVETKDSERLANFQYAAPEQKMRGAPVDRRADIFSLGLILNEMFTGAVPNGTGYKTIGRIDRAYGALDSLVERMIRQDPSERPGTVGEVKDFLLKSEATFVRREELGSPDGGITSKTIETN